MAVDAQTLTALYRRLEVPLYRKCLSMLGDEDAARDAAQDVFVKLSAAFESLQAPEAELAWALQAAHRHCLNVQRSHRRRVVREAGDGTAEEATHSPVTNRQLGRALLEGLSETSRALVVASVLDDEAQVELARRHGVSTKTVSRKLKSAFEKARARLKPKAK